MLQLFIRIGLVGAGAGVTGFFGTILMTYAFELLQQFAMLLVIAIGGWVAGWLFLIKFLQSQSNSLLQFIGSIAEQVMTYTALFQGILYTALVFMVVGTTSGFGELADTASGVAYELSFVMGYLAIFIFGASSLTISFTYYHPRNRLLGVLYGIVSVGIVVVALLFGTEWLRNLAEENVILFVVLVIVYLNLWSFLFMSIHTIVEDPIYAKKAKLKQRLKDNRG